MGAAGTGIRASQLAPTPGRPSTRRDNRDDGEPITGLLLQVALKAAGIFQPRLGVVDEADERAAVGVLGVPTNIREQLVAERLRRHGRARHLRLDPELLRLQQEVYGGR